jgi:hypothetical protein
VKKAPSSKHQIPNKTQGRNKGKAQNGIIPVLSFLLLLLWICLGFGAWDLVLS